jgi:hypothetical protein
MRMIAFFVTEVAKVEVDVVEAVEEAQIQIINRGTRVHIILIFDREK